MGLNTCRSVWLRAGNPWLCTGEVGFVSPFRYTPIIGPTGLRVSMVGDLPDLPTLIRNLLIVTTGIYTFHREQLLSNNSLTDWKFTSSSARLVYFEPSKVTWTLRVCSLSNYIERSALLPWGMKLDLVQKKPNVQKPSVAEPFIRVVTRTLLAW